MHNEPIAPPRDFDEWSALARSDLQAFENCRERIIEETIQRAPVHRQQRLRRMQWKLNQIRNTSRTPMIACLRMNRLLWQSVTGERGLLVSLNQPDTLRRAVSAGQATGLVIPFERFHRKLAVRGTMK